VDLRNARKKIFIVASFVLIAFCIFLLYRTNAVKTSMNPSEVKYRDYAGYGGRFTYKLPADWKTTEQKFEGNEILYHNDFFSSDKKIYGYVQLWNLNIKLKDFIEEGIAGITGIVNLKDYSLEPIKINDKQGYLLQYTKELEKGKYLKAFEVFVIDIDSTFHRFSFFMDEKSWKDEYRMFFLNIASSARYK
jgi:hypothetical protein